METEFRPINWNLAWLRQDPFPSTPPRYPTEAIWAGFPELKNQLDSLFVEALTTSRTEIVLNRGEYGSGKTHAAFYYQLPERLPSIKGRQVMDSWIFYIRTPREPEKADMLLYRSIIEAVRFRRLRTVVQQIITSFGSDAALRKLQEVVESEVLGKALWLLGFEKKNSGQLSLFKEDEGSEEWQRLLEAYFFGQTTKSDLKQLSLSRGIDSTRDRFQLLGGVLQILTDLAPTEEIEHHHRVILWIDEMENLIYYPSRYYHPFTEGLRDLIDQLPYYFTLMMNFTLASPEAFEDIRTVLGKALLDRITHQIYFREPSEEEAFDYVTDLLAEYRLEGWNSQELPATYPFAEDALRMLITNLPTRTPRDLNQECNEVISQSLRRGIILERGQGIINEDFIRDLTQERINLDIG